MNCMTITTMGVENVSNITLESSMGNLSHAPSNAQQLTLSLVLGLTIIILNVFTLYAIIKSEKLREKYALLIGSLCIADVMVGCVFITVTFIQMYVNDVTFTVYGCNFPNALYTVIINMPSFCSTWHPVVMTIDRIIAIEYPFQYHQILTPVKFRLLVASAWVVATLEAFFTWLVFYMEFCIKDSHSISGSVFLYFVHTVLVINTGIYGRIWWIVQKQKVKFRDQIRDSDAQNRIDKTTVMIFFIVSIAFILWLPYFLYHMVVYFLMQNSDFSSGIGPQISYFTSQRGYTFCIFNNVIYAIMNKDFREAYVDLLKCCKKATSK